MTLLDEDGDGEISWAEIEGGARGAFHRCEEALTRAWRVLAPHKTKLLAGAGHFLLPRREFQVHDPLLGLLRYDGVAARQASTHGADGVLQGRQARVCEKRAPTESGARHAETLLARARGVQRRRRGASKNYQGGRARGPIAAQDLHFVVRGHRWPKVTRSMQGGLLGHICCLRRRALLDGGQGWCWLGPRHAVANAVNAVVAPVVASMLGRRTLRDRALSNKDIQQAVEDMSEAAGVDDDDVQGWIESIIGLCASALGIYVAHRLDDVVFLYGACGAGAALAVDKCAEMGFSFKPRARTSSSARSRVQGFAYQTTGIGPGLPFFVRWPLLPFRASEACLASLAYGIRAADARAA